MLFSCDLTQAVIIYSVTTPY